jgi:hypothetical protein
VIYRRLRSRPQGPLINSGRSSRGQRRQQGLVLRISLKPIADSDARSKAATLSHLGPLRARSSGLRECRRGSKSGGEASPEEKRLGRRNDSGGETSPEEKRLGRRNESGGEATATPCSVRVPNPPSHLECCLPSNRSVTPLVRGGRRADTGRSCQFAQAVASPSARWIPVGHDCRIHDRGRR